MAKYDNYFSVGQRFGEWIIVDTKICRDNPYSKAMVLAQCSCGTKKWCCASSLTRGKSTCCGKPIHRTGNRGSNWKGFGNISGSLIIKLRWGAKLREIDFAISGEYLLEMLELQKHRCALSGKKLTPQNMSADRLDSSQGYVEGNIQWVTKQINMMKRSMSNSDFIKLSKQIVEYNK